MRYCWTITKIFILKIIYYIFLSKACVARIPVFLIFLYHIMRNKMNAYLSCDLIRFKLMKYHKMYHWLLARHLGPPGD
jgi:hypothetical protein